MDPEAALAQLHDALDAGDRDDALDALDALAGWIAGGGYLPALPERVAR